MNSSENSSSSIHDRTRLTVDGEAIPFFNTRCFLTFIQMSFAPFQASSYGCFPGKETAYQAHQYFCKVMFGCPSVSGIRHCLHILQERLCPEAVFSLLSFASVGQFAGQHNRYIRRLLSAPQYDECVKPRGVGRSTVHCLLPRLHYKNVDGENVL